MRRLPLPVAQQQRKLQAPGLADESSGSDGPRLKAEKACKQPILAEDGQRR